MTFFPILLITLAHFKLKLWLDHQNRSFKFKNGSKDNSCIFIYIENEKEPRQKQGETLKIYPEGGENVSHFMVNQSSRVTTSISFWTNTDHWPTTRKTITPTGAACELKTRVDCWRANTLTTAKNTCVTEESAFQPLQAVFMKSHKGSKCFPGTTTGTKYDFLQKQTLKKESLDPL